MQWPKRLNVTISRLLIYAALPLAYIISGRLGLLLAVPPGYATAVFLPAGIAVAAMFIAGAATLPGTFVGSFLLNIWIGYSLGHHLDGAGVAAASAIAFASMLQAAIGGTLLRRFIGYPATLDKFRELLFFLLLSPVVCLTSATLSLSGLWLLAVVQPGDLIINWLTWWAGDALGVLLALPLMLVFAGEPRPIWRSRATSVATPMIFCFALFVAIFVHVSRWENDQSLMEFRMQSQHVADNLKARLEEQILFLEQFSSIFTSRQLALTRKDFHNLVQKRLQQFPTIQAVEWAPKVFSGERTTFEKRQRTDLADFVIRDSDASGELQPAGDRSQFFPVTYVEPLAGNEQAVGFDLAFERNRRGAIDAAIASGQVTATAPVRLVQERAEQMGILLIQAVESGPTGSGVVLVALRMGTFTGTLAEPLQPTLNLKFADATFSTRPFFDSLPRATEPLYERSFDLGSRRYVIQTAPSAVYLIQHRRWQSWGVLAAGALSTGLLGGLLLLGTGHTYRLQQLTSNLRESETRKSAVMESALDAVITMNNEGRIVDFNPAAEQLFGYRRDEVVGKTVAETIIPHRLREAHEKGLRNYLNTGQGPVLGRRIEMPALRSDGSTFASELAISAASLSDGRILFTAYLRDITERKRAAEAEKTLIGELQHRSNNLLAVIQAIAHRSLSGNSPLVKEREKFEARLQALARTHQQLTRSSWSGVNLREILNSELEPFSARTKIEGVDVLLGPQAAQNFSLAVHELATNAVKYGALSTPGGEIRISWTVIKNGRENVLKFQWKEQGGPMVVAPQHQGFGSSLLKSTLSGVFFDYAPDGFGCTLELKLSGLKAEHPNPPSI